MVDRFGNMFCGHSYADTNDLIGYDMLGTIRMTLRIYCLQFPILLVIAEVKTTRIYVTKCIAD